MTTIKLNFCNIRGLSRKSNLNDVHQHLENEKPAFLGLTETILDANKSNGPDYQFENHTLHSKFRKKVKKCHQSVNDRVTKMLFGKISTCFDSIRINALPVVSELLEQWYIGTALVDL